MILYSNVYGREEVEALRKRPANELNPEELWAAHGGFVMKQLHKIAARFPRIEVEELIYPAWKMMIHNQKSYDPSKGSFCNYLMTFFRIKMIQFIWCELQNRPHAGSYHREKKAGNNPNLYGDSWDEIFASRDKEGESSSEPHLHRRVLEALGLKDVYEELPDLETEAKLKEVERRLTRWSKSSDSHRRQIGERGLEVLVKGRTGSEVARELGIGRAAVNNSIREARFLLQDIFGFPKVKLSRLTGVTNGSRNPPKGSYLTMGRKQTGGATVF